MNQTLKFRSYMYWKFRINDPRKSKFQFIGLAGPVRSGPQGFGPKHILMIRVDSTRIRPAPAAQNLNFTQLGHPT